MKKSYKKVIIIQAIIFIALWLNSINNVMKNNIIYGIYLFLLLGLSYMLLGYEKEEKVKKLDVLRIVFVYSSIFLMAIYFLGLLVGFVRNPYNLDKFWNNITIPFIIIVIEELIRYIIIKKSTLKMALILTLLFIILEITINYSYYPLANPMDVFNLFALLIIPTITKHILLTYIAYKGFYGVNILYRATFELNAFVLPIYPNIGVYLEVIFNVIMPTLIYISIEKLYVKQKFSKQMKLLILPPIIVLALLVILISGKTKYHAMAVGSGSMEPTINIADVVVVEKTLDLKLGDILVHEHGGKIVLHRIIKIEEVFDDFCYYTKGDANESEDNYLICEENIIGKVIQRVPLIGWPSVILERTMNKR